MEISPRSGRGGCATSRSGSGYLAARAARFNDVILEVDAATLRSPIVHVNAIGIDSPTIVYERGGKTTNLDVIARSVEAYARRTEEDAGKRSAGVTTKRKYIIDRLLIRGAKVTMTSPALRGQGVTSTWGHRIARYRQAPGRRDREPGRPWSNAVVRHGSRRGPPNIDLLREGRRRGRDRRPARPHPLGAPLRCPTACRRNGDIRLGCSRWSNLLPVAKLVCRQETTRSARSTRIILICPRTSRASARHSSRPWGSRFRPRPAPSPSTTPTCGAAANRRRPKRAGLNRVA